MTYTIEPIDISNKKVEDELRALYKDAFDNPTLFAEGYLYKNTNTKASHPTFFLAAIESGVIIGCSAFIAIDFFSKEKTYTCYQVAWSATHPKHQGRRIYVNLVNYAIDYLRPKGAGFLFAMANDKSHPILTKKIGFTETPSVILRIPNIPVVKNLFFDNRSSSVVKQLADSALMVKEEQLIALKKQENRGNIEVITINDSFIWGKINKVKKFGISLRVFYVGGVSLKDPLDYKKMIDKIFSKYNISYVQIVSDESNSSNLMLKKWKKASMNGFIYFNIDAVDFQHINIMFGIIDVF